MVENLWYPTKQVTRYGSMQNQKETQSSMDACLYLLEGPYLCAYT